MNRQWGNRVRQRACQKGFTLIELMVVIIVLGILVAVAMPNMISAQQRARVASLKTNAHTLQTVIETYHADNSVYPNSADQIEKLDAYQLFSNPFMPDRHGKAGQSGVGAWWTNDDGDSTAAASALLGPCGESDRSRGLVIYVGLDAGGLATTTFDSVDGSNGSTNPTTSYLLYGCDEAGQTIRRFVLTTGQLTAAAAALAAD